MRRSALIAAILGTVGLKSDIPRADDRPPGAVDPQVTRVEAGGHWEHAGQSGRYRAIVRKRCSAEHCYDDLFVEWVAWARPERTAGATYTVVATTRISEVGGLTNVSELRMVYSKTKTRLEVEHGSVDAEAKRTFCLTFGDPGKYGTAKGRCRGAG